MAWDLWCSRNNQTVADRIRDPEKKRLFLKLGAEIAAMGSPPFPGKDKLNG